MSVNRPQQGEYLPYYDRYISLVPDGDIIVILQKQIEKTLLILRALPEAQGSFRYAPNKWSIKEVLGHMIDSERIFAYRALRFSRNDMTPLPGYEQDDYIRNSSFDSFPLNELIDEFEHVRKSTILFLKHLTPEAWTRRGIANNAEVSVRALAYVIAGHELHHLNVLKAKYLEC
jgi:hypothetical protein